MASHITGALQLGVMALATRSIGPLGRRAMLHLPRMLTEGWNPLFGTDWPVGTTLYSYLYNATESPPFTFTEPNVTVIGSCEVGTFDCECLLEGEECNKKAPFYDADECAVNNLEYKPTQELTWAIIVGSIMAAVMAFGIGANDSANSWATAIGSGAIRSTYGLLIGGAAEWAGAVLLGYAVSGTIKKGIAPLDEAECWACGYCDSKMAWYAAAMVATLVGAVVFTMLATWTSMPISTTHAVIGGSCGATIAATSFGCLNWSFSGGGLFSVMASWVISPVLSGLIAATSYTFICKCALNRSNPRKHTLIAVVVCSFLTSFIMVFMVMLKSQYTKALSIWIRLGTGLGGGLLVAAFFAIVVVPLLRRNWPSEQEALNSGDEDDNLKGEAVEMSKSIMGKQIPEEDEDDGEGTYKAHGSSSMRAGEGVGGSIARASQSFGGLAGGVTGVGGKEYLDAVSAGEKARPASAFSFSSFGSAPRILSALNPKQTAEDVLDSDSFIPEEVKEAKKAIDNDNYTIAQKDAVWAFRYLLVYQAALESFAHGANDTANATGAFMAVYSAYNNGIYDCNMDENHQWIMVVAGFFVALGVNTFGYKVIRTIGTNMTDVNFVRGWCVEFATTVAVVLATIMGMPVSTTHCVVGAVVAVGLVANGRHGVAWGLVGKIFASWIVTLPFAGAVGFGFSWLMSLGVRA